MVIREYVSLIVDDYSGTQAALWGRNHLVEEVLAEEISELLGSLWAALLCLRLGGDRYDGWGDVLSDLFKSLREFIR